jgi:hypothetical protein
MMIDKDRARELARDLRLARGATDTRYHALFEAVALILDHIAAVQEG